ncbi:tax1-binding protein 1 homolog B-like isoform X2 [Littorina saxatilis]|uniref:tax1-binding protein 1 homolog B-like isoform X2 n=1 Tax=Littorina saxatilis TaxID=31220 RepID=UPI0038B61A20
MSKGAEKNFALVVFSQVPEFFPTDANVECHFTVTSGVEPSTWDWVGLYKVGWSNKNQQLCYEWAPAPGTKTNGEAKLRVVFPAKSLPKEEGEFYQFVYISNAQGTIGCSTPFQFRKPRATDFVEEEFGDMMFIRSKTTVMQEKIQQLEQELLVLNQERDKLQERVASLVQDVKERDTVIGSLTEDLAQEVEDKEAKMKEIQSLKLEAEGERDDAWRALEEAKRRKTELEATIKTLQSQKDALSGANQSLLDELAIYKEQVTESQNTAASKIKEVDHLTAMLQQMVEKSASTEQALQELGSVDRDKTEAMMRKEEELVNTVATLRNAESEVEALKNEVQSSADMLLACQTMKDKMREDLKAYEQTQGKMSSTLEMQESDMRELQEALKRKSEECDNLTELLQGLEVELQQKTQQLSQTQVQVTKTKENVNNIAAQLDTSVDQRTELEKDLEKCNSALEKLRAELASTKMELLETKDELKALREEAGEDYAALSQELEEKNLQLRELVHSNKQRESERIDEQRHVKQAIEAAQEVEAEKKEKFVQQGRRITDLERQLVCKDEELQNLRAELQTKEHEIVWKTEALTELERQIEVTQQEIVGKKEAIAKLQDDLDLSEKELEVKDTHIVTLQKALKVKVKESAAKDEEIAYLDEQVASKGAEACDEEEDEGSKFALMVANKSLRERLEDKNKELDSLRSEKRRWDQDKMDCEQEVKDLRARLEMGKVEYTRLMQDNNRNIRKLQKHKEVKRSSAPVASAAASHDHSYSSASSSSSPCSSPFPSNASDDQGKHKYKRLYHLEKRSLEELKVVHARTEHSLEGKVAEVFMLESRVAALTERLGSLEAENRALSMAEDDTQDCAFHDSLASVPSVASVEEIQPIQREEKEAQPTKLLYPNPYSVGSFSDSGDSAQMKVLMERFARSDSAVYIPTTEEDVGSNQDHLSSASEEEGDLPRPLVPEVMPQAKLAAVKQQICCGGSGHDADDQLLFEDCSPELPALEESFMDAIGEGMNICPQCEASGLASGAFNEHVAEHLGRICPVCKNLADDSMSQQDYEQHVNRCCEATVEREEEDGSE